MTTFFSSAFQSYGGMAKERPFQRGIQQLSQEEIQKSGREEVREDDLEEERCLEKKRNVGSLSLATEGGRCCSVLSTLLLAISITFW